MDVLYFVYGLAFVIMGVIILAQPRERSQFSFGDALPPLAGFGLFHGVHEWLVMWNLHDAPGTRCPLCIATLTASYLLLLEFGRRLAGLPELRRQRLIRLVAAWSTPRFYPLLGAAVIGGAMLTGELYDTASIWVRYLICIPASLLTSAGLFSYCRAERGRLRRMGVLPYFRLATVSFALYALLAGLFVPAGGFFPADRINSGSFMTVTGLPPEAFRAMVAILATIALAHIMRLFHHEMNERLARTLARAEESLRQLRELSCRHALILRHAGSGIVGLDETGTCAYANPAALTILGRGPTELLGRPFAAAVPCRLAESAALVDHCPIAAALAAGEVRRSDGHTFLRPDGSAVAVDYVLVPTPGDGAVLVFNDVTERKQAEARLQETAQMLAEKSAFLEQANADLQRYAYVAAHDLRAPLRGVSMLATTLEADAREGRFESALRHAGLIRQRVLKMDRLIVSLLEYARAGRVTGRPEPVDTAALVRDVTATLDLPPGFRVETAGPLPTLYTQRVALEQVMGNLIGNAVCHHDRSDGLVRIAAASDPSTGTTEFHVEDDGPGIDPSYHHRVFEMFQVLAPDPRTERSGIGLALVKRLVEQVGGRVRIESVGRGTTVRFTWPAGPAPGRARPLLPVRSAQGR